MLDKVVPLPMHECFNRMPAMFHPNKRSYVKNTKKPPNPKSKPQTPAKKKKKKKKNAKKKEDNDASGDTSS